MTMEAQIKKGVLEMCVLFTIREKETYGYDVMRTMRRFFPEVNESTFYAILRRLHADGSALTTQSGESNGPPRKYYRITEAGLATLQKNIEGWRRVKSAVEEMGIR
ncbi:MAG: PadR family transcriptional regulator [Oscillospiraceae bacterium]|jgi:PadR family transcriptional regulator PadR|nr:PadR family transcriptional regulator [Oscillospiraceae bacterium]